jgi:3-oxoacyl-[acyl-carrier protein] reductase
VVTSSADALGGIDIIASNVSALAIEDKPENWAASFEVGLMAAVRMVNAAMPYLEASSALSIVAVSSVSGREIDFGAGPYGMFKAALIHYMQGLAHQLATRGSALTRFRRATPTSRARACERTSSKACPTCSRPGWR